MTSSEATLQVALGTEAGWMPPVLVKLGPPTKEELAAVLFGEEMSMTQ